MYRLEAVESYQVLKTECKAVSDRAITEALWDMNRKAYAAGLKDTYYRVKGDDVTLRPAIVKTASASEIARWPELSAWRAELTQPAWAQWHPSILWVRMDAATA